MTFMKFGTYEGRPRYYLTVEGETQDAFKMSGSPSIKGDMRDKMEIYFTQKIIVKYAASGTITPSNNDVLWRVDSVEIPSFEYEFYTEDGFRFERIRAYNEPTYPIVVDDEVYDEINGFEVEVIADTEDPSTWDFRIVDIY